jgi:hypothetical protein
MPLKYDIFISYSREDDEQGKIGRLLGWIKKEFTSTSSGNELHAFFDSEEVHGMQDWRQRILQGLRDSRLLLACVSPTYLTSPNCEWELVEYLKYEVGHLYGFYGIAPIYLVTVPEWEKSPAQEPPAWIA